MKKVLGFSISVYALFLIFLNIAVIKSGGLPVTYVNETVPRVPFNPLLHIMLILAAVLIFILGILIFISKKGRILGLLSLLLFASTAFCIKGVYLSGALMLVLVPLLCLTVLFLADRNRLK